MNRSAVALGLLMALPIPAQAASPFDGVWNTSMVCPTAADGAFGYSHQFQVRITDGMLLGAFGRDGSPGWVSLEGSINQAGKAMLLGRGLTGPPTYAVGRPAEATAYRFHVDAQFEASQGSGERVEARRCSFQFSRG